MGGLGCVNMEGRVRFPEKVIMNNMNYCQVQKSGVQTERQTDRHSQLQRSLVSQNLRGSFKLIVCDILKVCTMIFTA